MKPEFGRRFMVVPDDLTMCAAFWFGEVEVREALPRARHA